MPEGNFEALLNLLRSGPASVQHAELSAIRGDILKRAADLRAEEHENRFFKVTLWRSRDGEESLRLHLWPGAVGARSNIHGHGWKFTSLILAGRLRQEHYVRGDGQRVARFRYRAGSQAPLEPDGERAIRLARSEMLDAGEIYSFEPSALHRISSCAESGTASLVLTQERADASDVEVYREGAAGPRRRRTHDVAAFLRTLFARTADPLP